MGKDNDKNKAKNKAKNNQPGIPSSDGGRIGRDPYEYVDPDAPASEEGSAEDSYPPEFHRALDKIFSRRKATPEENKRQAELIRLLDELFDNWA